jgi:hypothetical protein
MLDDAPVVLARACAFAIHACLTERELVVDVGGFDETLRTCEDWDLWQRVARVAGRPVLISATAARYHIRAASQSFDTAMLLIDALRVIDRGYQPPVARMDGEALRSPTPRTSPAAPRRRHGAARHRQRPSRYSVWPYAHLLRRDSFFRPTRSPRRPWRRIVRPAV